MAATANNINIDIIDLEKIITETSTYMQDYKDKLEKGDVIKMARTQESSIKSKMRSLIKNNNDKLDSIKELEKEYKVPFAELDVMWLQVKSKMGIVNKHAPKPKNIAEEEVKEVIEETKEPIKIKGKITNVKNADEEIPLPYAVTEKEIEETNEEFLKNNKGITVEEALKMEVEKAVFKNPNKSKLKILEQTIKGEYGIYVKSSEGVSTEGKTYKDIIELEEEKKSLEDSINNKENKIKEEIEKLNKDIEKIGRTRLNIKGNVEEIKEIFQM